MSLPQPYQNVLLLCLPWIIMVTNTLKKEKPTKRQILGLPKYNWRKARGYKGIKLARCKNLSLLIKDNILSRNYILAMSSESWVSSPRARKVLKTNSTERGQMILIDPLSLRESSSF